MLSVIQPIPRHLLDSGKDADVSMSFTINNK